MKLSRLGLLLGDRIKKTGAWDPNTRTVGGGGSEKKSVAGDRNNRTVSGDYSRIKELLTCEIKVYYRLGKEKGTIAWD